MLDQPQFFVEPTHGLGVIEGAWRIAFLHPGVAQLRQCLRGGGSIGSPEVGEGVPQVARQIECPAALRDGQGSGDSIWTVMKQRYDFFQWPQVKLAVGISHPMRAIERRAMTDGDHDVVQPVELAGVVVDIASRYGAKAQVTSNLRQRARERQIPADSISLDFDKKPIGPKYRLAPRCKFARRAQSSVLQCSRQQSIAA